MCVRVLKALMRRVATSVVDHLNARFPPHHLYSCFKVLDPTAMRESKKDETANFGMYGRKELDSICTHLSNIQYLQISKQTAQEEWHTIKSHIVSGI